MSDGKKQLSGAEYRKRAEIKKEEQKEVIRQTVKIEKIPAIWITDDNLREMTTRYGFDQNKSCAFSKSGRIYADQRRFLPISIFQRKMKNNENIELG